MPPHYELIVPEISRYDQGIKRYTGKKKPPGTEVPKGLGGPKYNALEG